MIDRLNHIIDAREAIIDVEVENLDSLITEIIELRGCWNYIMEEAKLVATSMSISNTFESTSSRRRKRYFDESPDLLQQEPNGNNQETNFKQRVFFTIIDSVVDGLSRKFKFAQEIRFCGNT